jgi:hypothetical protein
MGLFQVGGLEVESSLVVRWDCIDYISCNNSLLFVHLPHKRYRYLHNFFGVSCTAVIKAIKNTIVQIDPKVG